MAMRQVSSCGTQALNERSDCCDQSREKKHWVHLNAQTNAKTNQ